MGINNGEIDAVDYAHELIKEVWKMQDYKNTQNTQNAQISLSEQKISKVSTDKVSVSLKWQRDLSQRGQNSYTV